MRFSFIANLLLILIFISLNTAEKTSEIPQQTSEPVPITSSDISDNRKLINL